MVMHKTVRSLLGLFFAALLTASCSSSPPESTVKPVYKIGYMICNSKEETLARFVPLTEYLSRKMGVSFEAVAIDTVDFSNRIEELHFTHTNSLLYIMMSRFHGVEVLAVDRQGSLNDRSRGIIAALKKHNLNSLADLRGRSMVFGPMFAPTGYMSQIDILQQNGFDPENDLAFYTIPQGSFKHEKVIYSVLYEKYDAGAFPFNDFELMAKQGKIDKDEFTVLAEGPLIPYCNFAATQKADDALADKMKATLLAITKEDTVQVGNQVLNVLEQARLDGFSGVKDSDFDVVREMAKRTNMPPYQKF